MNTQLGRETDTQHVDRQRGKHRTRRQVERATNKKTHSQKATINQIGAFKQRMAERQIKREREKKENRQTDRERQRPIDISKKR